MSVARWDRHELIAQYEALRREAIGTASISSRGHGLALFRLRGMHAWLAALTALVPPVRTAPLSRYDAATGGLGRLVPAQRAELTTVLAGMVLACTEKEEVGGELRGESHDQSRAPDGVPLRAPVLAPAGARSSREHGAAV